MADLTLSITITRTELSLADLELNDGSTYIVAGHDFEIGRVQRRRETAKSVFVHGGVEIASVKDLAMVTLGIEVIGSTVTNLRTNINTLIDAFSQSEYTLTATIDSGVFTYECYAADYQSTLTTPRLLARQGLIVFECPRQPGTEV